MSRRAQGSLGRRGGVFTGHRAVADGGEGSVRHPPVP